MNNLRRVLALTIVFAMVLGSTVAFATAPKFSDLDEASQKIVGVLASMSIIQGYEEGEGFVFKGEQTITRAEFAAVVARMLGMESSAKNQVPTIFTDVPQSHWASGYVAAATGKNNIIAGYGDGTFGPENPVKYEEAVKMLICALGYEPQAADEGGYPTGHLFVAQKNNLLVDANGYAGTDATRMTVAQLCFNALDIPLMERSVWGGSTPVYEIFDGTNGLARKTLMSEYLGLIKLAGVVTQNENSSSNKEGMISVSITDNYKSKYANDSRYSISTATASNVQDFYVGDTNAKDYIGMSVVFFATYESNRSTIPTIKFIDEETNRNKITIDVDDLMDAEVAANTIAISYYTDKDNYKFTKLYIPTGTNTNEPISVFVNGVAVNVSGEDIMNSINDKEFKNLSGSIEFVSTSSRGSADYNSVFITLYNNFVVESVNDDLYKILPADESPYESAISFDPSDRNILTTIKDENGAVVDPATLEEYDVLSMKLSTPDVLYGKFKANSKDVYDCTLVRKSITGTITELSTEKNAETGIDVVKEVTVDGTDYMLDPIAVELDHLSPKMSDSGIFYLDAIGKIVAFKIDDPVAGNYAVLLYAEAGGAINGARVKLLMPDGKMVTKSFASRVRYATKDNDGRNVVSSMDSSDFVTALEKDKSTLGTVCTYKENANGQISTMIFSLADEKPSSSTGRLSYDKAIYNAGHLTTNVDQAAGAEIRARNTTEKSLRVNGTSYWLDAGTIVINVDRTIVGEEDPKDWEYVTDSNISTYNISDIAYDQKLPDATVSVFDANLAGKPKFVLIDGKADITDPTKAVALIRTVRAAKNADDEEVFRLNAYTTLESAIQTYTLATDVEYNDSYGVGSAFVPVSVNANDEQKKINVLTTVDFDKGTVAATGTLATLSEDEESDVEYIYGRITRKSGSSIYVSNELKKTDLGENEEDSRIISNSFSVLECDLRVPQESAVKIRSISDVTLKRNTSTGEPEDGTVSEYKVLIRVYNGAVEDVVLYILPVITPAPEVTD